MFPIDLSSTTVKYDSSEVLKATATFSFDRYIAGKFDSYSVNRGTDNNKVNGIFQNLAVNTDVPIPDPRIPGTVILPASDPLNSPFTTTG
jgi:hypothetical protein